MKRFLHIVCLMTVLAVLSCTRLDVVQEPEWTDLEKELGLDLPEMPVRLGFDLPYEDPIGPETKASIVSGEEDPAEYIKSLHMVCFTKEGIYLGYREASLIGAERAFTHDGIECQGRELFEGSVPARTARIHFVGNVTPGVNIPGNDQIGGNENMLVKSAQMAVTLSNTRICYWGFHGEPSSEQMRDWLAVAKTVDGVVTYGKKDGSVVHMIRDRARVDFRYMLDFKRSNSDVTPGKSVTVNGNSYEIKSDGTITIGNSKIKMEANPTDYTIKQIDWILSNGLDHGYLAPYHEEAGTHDHFDGYYDPNARPALKEDRLTPYDKSGVTRYTATDSQMVTIYKDGMSQGNSSLFLFEDENDPSDPPKLILRVTYQRDGKADLVKYHTLMLLNERSEPCQIFRNHSYILDIYGLPWEGLGYLSFDDAVNSTTYANNMTVTINDKVPEVNDGRFKLSIEGDTYIIYQDPADARQEKEVFFEYSAAKTGETTTGLTADDFSVKWTSQIRPSFADENVSVSMESNDRTTFRGKISFTLGTTIGSSLQGGQIELHDNKTGMSRFLNIYTITKFNFVPTGSTSVKLVRDGTATRKVNELDCPTYYMDVRIPGDYPIGLYPIKIRMASTTLNPFKMVRLDTGEEDGDIAVSVEGTENGTELDGDKLSGMDYATTANSWKYQKAGEPWNFWYVKQLLNKPTTTDDEGKTVEDKSDIVYRIYFDDVRGLRASGNQASDIGLFLWIKYFGAAVAVTP